MGKEKKTPDNDRPEPRPNDRGRKDLSSIIHDNLQSERNWITFQRDTRNHARKSKSGGRQGGGMRGRGTNQITLPPKSAALRFDRGKPRCGSFLTLLKELWERDRRYLKSFASRKMKNRGIQTKWLRPDGLSRPRASLLSRKG